MRERIRAGEIADVAVMQRYLLDELLEQGKIASGSTSIQRSPTGLFVRMGGPRSDISSIEALKHALLAAESITYIDTAKGGLAGTHFASVLERLGNR